MTNRLISCNFHQLFRNDPSSTVLQMASISTNHLGITTQILSYEQHQHTVYFHQSFRNKRKTRHHQATDFHRFFRIAIFLLPALPLGQSIPLYWRSPHSHRY